MKKTILSKQRVILLLMGLVLLSACAASGPLYEPVNNMPENKGLIYFYHNPDTEHMSTGRIIVNDEPVADIKENGYYPYFAAEGLNEIYVPWRNEKMKILSLNVESGKTYFVQYEFMNFVKLVPDNEGKRAITECRLLEKYVPSEEAQDLEE